MNDEIYRQLRAKIDTYAIGFPATKSGVEIEILKKLFTPEEVEVALNLNMMPETVEAIAARMNRDPEQLLLVLTEMVRKGTIFNSLSPEGAVCFHGAPYMHGLAENQAGNMDPEMARLLDRYEEEGYLDHLGAMPMENILRFSPINEAVTPELTVATYNQIEELIKTKTTIAAIPCVCRDKAIALGAKCDLPTSNVCFVFDWLADYSVERGQAKYLTLDEALAIQKECEDAGLMNLPTNLQSTFVMCHCDGDFCINSRALKRLPKPARSVASDFYTQVAQDDCIGCDICIDRCPMDAITGNAAGTVDIKLDRCVGCGVCIKKCSVDALKLHEKPEEQKSRQPISPMEFVELVSGRRGMETTPIFSEAAI